MTKGHRILCMELRQPRTESCLPRVTWSCLVFSNASRVYRRIFCRLELYVSFIAGYPRATCKELMKTEVAA